MLADPQVITIDGNAKTLSRSLTGTSLGRFLDPSTVIEVETVPSKGGRLRTAVRMTSKKITSDPLVSTTNIRVDDTITLAINRPLDGFSDEEILKQVKGLIGWLNAGTDAVLKQIISGQN